MRNFIAFILLFISTFSNAQTELIDAKKIWARDSIRLGTNWIRSISKDTALLIVTDRDIPSAKSVKDFVLNRWNNGLVPWGNVTGKPANFSTTYALSNDVRDSIQSRVPYENATRNLILGNYRLSARTLLGDSLMSRSSAGTKILSNSGSVVAEFGGGGGAQWVNYGFAGYDINRASSYTARSFTDKNYVDSSRALDVQLAGTQTITGSKTFSNDIVANGVSIGLGGGAINNNISVGIRALSNNTTGSGNSAIGFNALANNTTGALNSAIGFNPLGNNTTGSFNSAIGFNALSRNTTGDGNSAVGFNALLSNTTGGYNSAVGASALFSNTTGSFNLAVAQGALSNNTTGSSNLALGVNAGRNIANGGDNTIADNSIYIGADTRAAASNQINQIVIGNQAIGLGSNTTVIGNSSTTFGRWFGRLGLGTSTDNGQDALQVEGSGKFSSSVTATGATFDRTATGSNYLQIKALNSASNDIANWFTDGTNSVFAGMMRGSAGSSDAAFHVLTGGSIRFTIASTGAATFSSSVTATGFIVSSDKRLKNIVSRSGDMVTYTLKADKKKILHYGYIAQEVEKVLPTTVSTDKDGIKAVNYIEVLVKKVNDLEKEIAELKKRNK